MAHLPSGNVVISREVAIKQSFNGKVSPQMIPEKIECNQKSTLPEIENRGATHKPIQNIASDEVIKNEAYPCKTEATSSAYAQLDRFIISSYDKSGKATSEISIKPQSQTVPETLDQTQQSNSLKNVLNQPTKQDRNQEENKDYVQKEKPAQNRKEKN
ncbi:MAG: hypothetical protein RMJ15_08540 [Nitrososphaerota archaeon]|nr:hypothetical protein [Candidatus Bathyarchaeota archaeon]MDW8023765.1 hypothetical protein [Nitrososphaerota archaeon]